jgi:membrane associated rhomboid family serine protease
MLEDVEVSRCADARQARTHMLVLVARGIRCRMSQDADAVRIYVAASDADKARSEIAAYAVENPPRAADPEIPLHRAAAPFVPAAAGITVYVVLLLGLFGLQRRGSWGLDWTGLGALDAGAVQEGALWLAATALTLHGDLGHLLSNLLFGSVVGAMVAAQFGVGAGWLAILAAGVLGNVLNAGFQPDQHTAVGASTAVFGGLGFLAGAAQGARRPGWRIGLRRWAPVAAGAMLLAFLGFGGERVDVGGHVAGFAVGVGLGLGVVRWSALALDDARVQLRAGLACLAILGLAWALALATA